MTELELLELLCCPDTHQALRPADPALLAQLNQQIAAGRLKNCGGRLLAEKLEGGLLRIDGKLLYPILHGIPVMLSAEAIPVG